MQVRTNGTSGTRLFDWNSEEQTITIVKKKVVYKVKLFNEYNGITYKIIDKHPRDC